MNLPYAPMILERVKCPASDCEERFHLWEDELRTAHLIRCHKEYYVAKLREAGLHAEASEIAAQS